MYFSANRDAPIFSELQAILSKTAGVTEVLRVALRPLLASGKVDAAFVYGSVAEGKQTSGSDVDVFLLGGATMAEIVAAIREAESRLGRDVNPTIYSRKDLRPKLKAGSGFLRRVLTGPKLIIAGRHKCH